MIRTIIMRLIQIYEHIRSEGITSFLNKGIYINRKAVLIEKDLFDVNVNKNFLLNSNLKFIEISFDTINSGNYRFPIKNRSFKALYYLKKGYGGHAIVKGNEVIGDIWHSATTKCDTLSVHPDVFIFKIKSSDKYIYSFDQFVAPNERGNKVAAALLNGQINSLREKGFSKIVAYYWADNLPAIWNTRVINKFKELKTLRVFGLWFFKKVIDKNELE
jgi:hypothetical protein